MSHNTERLLGAVLLFQAVTSLVSGAALLNPLLDSNGIETTMENIRSGVAAVNAGILLELFTAMGIIALGALFYRFLAAVNKTAALTVFALYTAEAAILATSRILLHLFAAYCRTSAPSPALAQALLEGAAFAYNAHLLPFALGGALFYLLLWKSHFLPAALSVWGFVSILPFSIGMPLMLLGLDFPFLFFVPYVPFEFTAGIFILIKGLPGRPREIHLDRGKADPLS